MDLKLAKQWVDVCILFFLIIGFVVAILLTTPSLVYLTALMAGFAAARIYFLKKHTEPILPFVLIILGFLIGYLVGNFWSSRLLTLLSFSFGFGLSYFLHRKNIIGMFKSELFVK